MARVYLTATVPAAARDSAEALVSSFLVSPNAPGVYTFGVPLVPFAGPVDAIPTAYGTCAAVDDQGQLYAALPALAAAVPGTTYAVVSPWRAFRTQTHWIDWLAAQGLKPRSELA